jgi:hypothetical protein
MRYITCSEHDSMVTVQMAGETLVEGKTYNVITVTAATDEINNLCQDLADLNNDIITSGPITPAQEAERDELIGALRALSGKISCTVDPADGTVAVEINYVDASTMTAVTDPLVSGSTFTATSSGAVIEYAESRRGACPENSAKLSEYGEPGERRALRAPAAPGQQRDFLVGDTLLHKPTGRAGKVPRRDGEYLHERRIHLSR